MSCSFSCRVIGVWSAPLVGMMIAMERIQVLLQLGLTKEHLAGMLCSSLVLIALSTLSTKYTVFLNLRFIALFPVKIFFQLPVQYLDYFQNHKVSSYFDFLL